MDSLGARQTFFTSPRWGLQYGCKGPSSPSILSRRSTRGRGRSVHHLHYGRSLNGFHDGHGSGNTGISFWPRKMQFVFKMFLYIGRNRIRSTPRSTPNARQQFSNPTIRLSCPVSKVISLGSEVSPQRVHGNITIGNI
ncbi:hypothetical protein TNCV_4078601 [Trichonephila clavipes]|nr:hypothetical protein TNCV_4078601 [Trichonephila clavipes]